MQHYRERDYSRSQQRPYNRDNGGDGQYQHRSAGHQKGKRSSIILPPPHVLEAYARIIPDSPTMLMEMAEQEQQHRQDWENDFLKMYSRNHVLGQFFGVAISGAIMASVVYLSQQGDSLAAAGLGLGGFMFMSTSIIMTLKTKRFERKPRKPGERPRYNSSSEDHAYTPATNVQKREPSDPVEQAQRSYEYS